MEDERDRREKYVVLLDIPTTVVSREARIVTDVKYVPPPSPSASISAAAPQAISSSGLVSLSSTPSVPALLTQASDSGVSSLSSSSSSVVFEPPADNAANRSLPHVDIIRSSFEDDAAAATAAAATGAPSTTGEPQGLDQNMLDLSFAEKKLSPRNRSSSLGGAPTPGGPSPSSSSSSGPTEFDNYYVASTRLQKQILYETKTRFYLVGYTKSKHIFRVLKVHKTVSNKDSVSIDLDPVTYSGQEVQKLLYMIHDGNRHAGGLKKTTTAYGIHGFVKFLEGYYLLLVSKRRRIGSIGCHHVYGVERTAYVSLFQSRQANDDENRYKQLFFGMDLSDFCFSYTYDLTHSLQHNITSQSAPQYDDRFVWNHFLLQPLIKEVGPSSCWVLPMINGYFRQNKVSMSGHIVSMSVIARRSRHFAGTRFLKRGVNEQGRVANDVETEQIIEDVSHSSLATHAIHCSSYVQMRGSIPLYWGQEPRITDPKPPIFIQRFDPFYSATILHFQDLLKRFGSPIIVLNLIKEKEATPRESILRREFKIAVQQINNQLPPELHIHYIAFDFHRAAKSKGADVIDIMASIAEESLKLTGFFHAGPRVYSNLLHRDEQFKHLEYGGLEYDDGVFGRMQEGVLRSNCIDSLDRTNAAQYVMGQVVFGHQMYAMGLSDTPYIPFDSQVAKVLMELYQDMGNRLALQYGGSHLAHTVKTYQEKSLSSQSRDFFTTIRRYYSNSFVDKEKQDSINLFLGNFIPSQERIALWDLETDYYLHIKSAPNTDRLMSTTSWWKEPLAEWNAKKRRSTGALLKWKRMLQQQMHTQQRLFEQEKLSNVEEMGDNVGRIVAYTATRGGEANGDEVDLSMGDFSYFYDVHNPRKIFSFEKELLLPHHKLIMLQSDGESAPATESAFYGRAGQPLFRAQQKIKEKAKEKAPPPTAPPLKSSNTFLRRNQPASNTISLSVPPKTIRQYSKYVDLSQYQSIYDDAHTNESSRFYSRKMETALDTTPVLPSKVHATKTAAEYAAWGKDHETFMKEMAISTVDMDVYITTCSRITD